MLQNLSGFKRLHPKAKKCFSFAKIRDVR